MPEKLATVVSRSCWFCRPAKKRTSYCNGTTLVADVPIKRPDPAIYSQKQLYRIGGSPSWDSPDITRIEIDGHPAIAVTVHNLSSDIPVYEAVVHCDAAIVPGIGIEKHRIGSNLVNIQRSGEFQTTFLIPEAWSNYRVNVYVSIEFAGDKQNLNNYGEQVTWPLSGDNELRGLFRLKNNTSKKVDWELVVVSSNATQDTSIFPDRATLIPGEHTDHFVKALGYPLDGATVVTILARSQEEGLVGGMTFSNFYIDN